LTSHLFCITTVLVTEDGIQIERPMFISDKISFYSVLGKIYWVIIMNIVEITNVSKKFKYNKKDFFAVKDVSFSVANGEIFGLLGPNGAGKTTLLNIAVGILVQDAGQIKIFGGDIQKNSNILESISSVSGETRFHWGLRVNDVLTFYGMLYGLSKNEREKRISRLIKFFGLGRIRYRKFGYLSTGERMRLVFAKALLNYPKLLILDEPTLGLDPDMAIKVRQEIKRINKKFGTTIILTSHYMQEVEQLCDRVAFINKGKIVDIGTIDKIKSREFSTYEFIVKVKNIKDEKFLKSKGFKINGKILQKKIKAGEDVSNLVAMLSKRLEIVDIETKRPTLEDYFVKISGGNK